MPGGTKRLARLRTAREDINIISIAELLAFENVIRLLQHIRTALPGTDAGSALGRINPNVVNRAPVNAINKLTPAARCVLTAL